MLPRAGVAAGVVGVALGGEISFANMDSFIVRYWLKVFGFLRYISPFHVVRCILPKRLFTYGFVDCWVLLHFFGAIVVWAWIAASASRALSVAAVVYGGVRVWELLIYNVNVVFCDAGISADLALRGFRRSMLLGIHNFVEVVFWFAAFYRFLAHAPHFDAKVVPVVSTAGGSLYYSVVTSATVGYGDVTPGDPTTRWIVIAQIGVSIFLTLVVLSRFLSLLPKPLSQEPTENR